MRTLLTASEVAELLRMTRGAVYTAAQRGELPVVRLGRRLRFKQEDIERLLEVQSGTLAVGKGSSFAKPTR